MRYCVPPEGAGAALKPGADWERVPFRTHRESLAGAGHDPQAWRLALPRYVQQQAEGQSCSARAASQVSPVRLLQSRHRKHETFSPAAQGVGDQVFVGVVLSGGYVSHRAHDRISSRPMNLTKSLADTRASSLVLSDDTDALGHDQKTIKVRQSIAINESEQIFVRHLAARFVGARLCSILRMRDLFVRGLGVEAFGAPATDDGLGIADEVVDETHHTRRKERRDGMAVVDLIFLSFRGPVEAEDEEVAIFDGPVLRGRKGRESFSIASRRSSTAFAVLIQNAYCRLHSNT